MSVRIFIVDDHEIVREGIRTLITRSRPEWQIAGEATDGEQAVEACRTVKPDVIVLDITMPKLSGLEAAARIVDSGLGCQILMFTMHESARLSNEVRQVGAKGLVLKSQAGRDLIRAIDSLLAGGTFFDSEPVPNEAPSTDTANQNATPGHSMRGCRTPRIPHTFHPLSSGAFSSPRLARQTELEVGESDV